MKRCVCWAGVLLAAGWAAEARASGPLGVLGMIEKVVFEPKEQAPERAQIWGVFLVAVRGGNTLQYGPPTRGYLYYQAENDRGRQEWQELKRLVGTGKWVGFESAFRPELRVRAPGERPQAPDTYYADNVGVVSIDRARTRYVDDRAVQALLELPIPVDPGEGDLVPPGPITLKTRNILDNRHPKAGYVFEIDGKDGEKEVSPPVRAGAEETTWTPRLHLKPGVKYTWHVRAVDGDWKGPEFKSTFVTKGQR